ncbi:hypothetical protein JCM3774_003269 [Rhodotorula dairenensis]
MPATGGLNRWHFKRSQYGSRRLALKNHIVAAVGEYVGTTLFMLFALGATNIANLPTTSVTNNTTEGEAGSTVQTANTSNLLYIAFAFGISLTVTAWCFARISGGLFNPAITLGMFLIGALSPLRAAILTFVQILGGITGAAIIDALTPGTLNARTKLTPGMSISRGLFLEAAMTALLMLVILLLAADKNAASFMAPLPIGLALFVAELASVYWTGGSLNPARSFGPDVVLHSFYGYHWIYWAGPAIGATVAALFYRLIKYLERATAEGNEAENLQSSDSPPMHERTQTVDEPIRPKGRTRVEATGFAGGMHESGDISRPTTPRAEIPRELTNKVDRLEGMVSTILSHFENGHAVVRSTSADRLSGDTVAYPQIAKVMGDSPAHPATSPAMSHPAPTDARVDHPAWVRKEG